MMKFFIRFEALFRRLFPSTFTLAVLLTGVTMLLAWWLTGPLPEAGTESATPPKLSNDPLATVPNYLIQILGFWYAGMWNSSMLAFLVQMMLILVLGYVIAGTRAKKYIIDQVLHYCTTTAKAAFLVTLLTLLLSLFNWGIGLIFGAVFARKVAVSAKEAGRQLNYPLIGAAGYSGLMVWHGGLSGSAPLKVAEPGHLAQLTGQSLPPVPIEQTIFSSMNLSLTATLLIVLPGLLFFLGKKLPGRHFELTGPDEQPVSVPETVTGAERLDHNRWFGMILGAAFLFTALLRIFRGGFSVIDPNWLNLLLLGLAILLSGTIYQFLGQVRNAVSSAAGILIQFPLYFGIMGIMKYSGLVEIFSGWLLNVSNTVTFPIFTFLSAGLVNIFIPSGGGQWAVQGPVIIDAAQAMGIPLGKAVMALAYGDQLTNMLQPFWALPLLGITGLKAREILPYTLILMVAGGMVFLAGLLIF